MSATGGSCCTDDGKPKEENMETLSIVLECLSGAACGILAAWLLAWLLQWGAKHG